MGTVISCMNTVLRYHVKCVQYTGLDVCAARNSRNSLKEADYMYIRIDVLQVTHCAEHVPAITRPHQMHLGGLGMGPQVEIQYLHCIVRYRVKYTGLYNNQ